MPSLVFFIAYTFGQPYFTRRFYDVVTLVFIVSSYYIIIVIIILQYIRFVLKAMPNPMHTRTLKKLLLRVHNKQYRLQINIC